MTDPPSRQTPRYPVRLVSHSGPAFPPTCSGPGSGATGWSTPTRTEGGQRLYSDLDIERLSRLRRLTERGHAIGRIASLPLDELDQAG